MVHSYEIVFTSFPVCVTKLLVLFKAKKIMQGVKMKLIKVTRRQAVEKKIMTLRVCAVEVNLLVEVQLEALVVLAVKVPEVAAPVHTVLKAIVHQDHQGAAVRVAAVVVEAVVTVTVDQIVTPTQRKRMRKKSLVVQVRMMTERRNDNFRHDPMRQFCEIKFTIHFYNYPCIL